MAQGEGGKKKVMVAIDDSEFSHYALEWSLENLLDSISSSPLVVFTVQSLADLSYISAASFGAVHPELIKSLQDHQEKLSAALLEKAKEICAARGVTAETISEIGDPKEAICEAVEKFNISLLVLGSHGRGVIKRAVLGSVSSYCVHSAKCSVLVVKKPT